MTGLYASMEQLDLKDAHPSMDIWSLGIIAYTLMAKKEPYCQVSILKRLKAISDS
jgi:serine/threonine protein kinase